MLSTSNNKYKIALAGNGWGFWAALKGLITTFEEIELINPLEKELIDEFIFTNPSVKVIVSSGIQDIDSDYVICAGLKDIITSEMLFQKEFINIHYSLLPAYRGLHSTVWTIINNETYLGYTVYIMNEFIDDGYVIYQYQINNDFESTATYYMEHFNSHVEQNLGIVILDYLDGKTTPIKQNKSKASWVGKRNRKDCKINFNSTIFELKAFFRALNEPYPKPFFESNSVIYIPEKISFHPSNIKTHLGRILNIDNEGIWVKILDGYIIVNEIVNEQGKKIPNTHFKIGKRLLT